MSPWRVRIGDYHMNDAELTIRDGNREIKINGIIENITTEKIGSWPIGGKETMMRLEVVLLVNNMVIDQLEQIEKLGGGRILQFPTNS